MRQLQQRVSWWSHFKTGHQLHRRRNMAVRQLMEGWRNQGVLTQARESRKNSDMPTEKGLAVLQAAQRIGHIRGLWQPLESSALLWVMQKRYVRVSIGKVLLWQFRCLRKYCQLMSTTDKMKAICFGMHSFFIGCPFFVFPLLFEKQAHECKRVGGYISEHWKRQTGCDSNSTALANWLTTSSQLPPHTLHRRRKKMRQRLRAGSSLNSLKLHHHFHHSNLEQQSHELLHEQDQMDFLSKHVPRKLLIQSHSSSRTPPPLVWFLQRWCVGGESDAICLQVRWRFSLKPSTIDDALHHAICKASF